MKGGNMNIKYFPPMGTRSNEKVSNSEQAKVTAENAKSGAIVVSKDVFEQAIRGTVDELLSKAKPQDSHTKVEPEKLELVGNCITFRAEVAGSCIPMKKLEPVADCEPGTLKFKPNSRK
jgi:hypothetical protein